MPNYVYECKSCQKSFEIEQRITEEPLKDCNCGSAGSLKRVIQPTGIVFKGSGFHINDYPSSSSKSSAPTKSESSSHSCSSTCQCPH